MENWYRLKKDKMEFRPNHGPFENIWFRHGENYPESVIPKDMLELFEPLIKKDVKKKSEPEPKEKPADDGIVTIDEIR